MYILETYSLVAMTFCKIRSIISFIILSKFLWFDIFFHLLVPIRVRNNDRDDDEDWDCTDITLCLPFGVAMPGFHLACAWRRLGDCRCSTMQANTATRGNKTNSKVTPSTDTIDGVC